MPAQPRILAFAASTRRESFNRRLLHLAVEGAQAAGADVTLLDLADHELPLYNADLEERLGLPEAARRLKAILKEHDGLLLASPEYNSSFTPLLKNTLDWASRSEPGEAPLAAYAGKVVTLMSASPGGLGGIRGLAQVRVLLAALGCIVLPEQVCVPAAHKAFGPDGRLTDPSLQARAQALGSDLCGVLRRLKA